MMFANLVQDDLHEIGLGEMYVGEMCQDEREEKLYHDVDLQHQEKVLHYLDVHQAHQHIVSRPIFHILHEYLELRIRESHIRPPFYLEEKQSLG